MTAARRLALAFALVHELFRPNVARAQGVFEVLPLFGISQVYDSNLFSTPLDRQADFITRISPGVESTYRSSLLTLASRYTIDVERFANHPELTSTDARQHAALDVTYHPSRRLVLAGGADLAKTQTPGDLNSATGLALTRADAQRIAPRFSISQQLGHVTTGTIDYTFTDDRLAGGFDTRTHAAGVGARHLLSPRDTVSAGYRVQQFFFEGVSDVTSSATSHAMSVGWTRALTRQTRFSIDAGPRVANGSPSPDVSASIQHRIRPLDLSLSYTRRATTILGLPGTADTQSATASAAWSLPRRSLQVRVAPAFFRSAHALLREDVYRLAVDVARPIADNFALNVALDMTLQPGNRSAMLRRDPLARHTATISLVAAPTVRR